MVSPMVSPHMQKTKSSKSSVWSLPAPLSVNIKIPKTFLDLFFQKSQIYISTFLDVLLQKISNIFIYFLDYLSKANYQFDQQNWEEWVERRNGFHISARSQSTLKSKTYFNISWFPSLNFLLGETLQFCMIEFQVQLIGCYPLQFNF